MNTMQKNGVIKNGLRKGFQDGSSKMAKRKCYRYTINSDGELEINPDKAKVVNWMFERHLAGDSLGKIAAVLVEGRAFSLPLEVQMEPGGDRQIAFQRKYTGRVLLQKLLALALFKSKTTASWYLYTDTHEAIIA